jgi:predicted  nucleic acid-binding Zn-ribbon protein
MKKLFFIFLLFVILLPLSDSAIGACDCKQPAYRDEIDFLTRYTACLEQCYNSQFESFRLQIDAYDQRIADLESQLQRLKGRIKLLEGELSAVRDKKGEKQWKK